MITTNTQNFSVELVENEILKVELTQIDVVNKISESLETFLILNEVPTKLTVRTFQTANNYIEDSLVVYYNGMKLLSSDFTIIDSQTFKFGIDTLVGDGVEVSYIKA